MPDITTSPGQVRTQKYFKDLRVAEAPVPKYQKKGNAILLLQHIHTWVSSNSIFKKVVGISLFSYGTHGKGKHQIRPQI